MTIRKSCNEMTVDQERASEKKKILNFYFNLVVLTHCILFNKLNFFFFFFWDTGVAATNYEAFGGQIQVDTDDSSNPMKHILSM